MAGSEARNDFGMAAARVNINASSVGGHTFKYGYGTASVG